MGRTVSAVVTVAGECLGGVGPFPVDVPWWSEVEPVVEVVERRLRVPVVVLRLLSTHGADGMRDGHVTYHVEAARAPAAGLLTPVHFVPDQQPLRQPWATAAGLRELLDWAADAGSAVGPAIQRKTWNLAALFRLPTAAGTAWLKATPPFAADEAMVIALAAAVDPSLVPEVLAAGPGRMLLADLPGEDCWDASPAVVESAVRRLVAVQASLATGQRPAGLRDRRPVRLAGEVDTLLAGAAGALTTAELADARALSVRWEALAGCGLPDTLVHGDFHPGNWRADAGPPTVLDWADAHWGSPVLDGLRAIDFLPAERRPFATATWVDAWARHVPGSRPAAALAVAGPLAHLAYAVRYQEFLDGIEPSERIYHLGDPAASVRAALACAKSSPLDVKRT